MPRCMRLSEARGKSVRGGDGEQSAGFIGVTNELLIQFHGRRAVGL